MLCSAAATLALAHRTTHFYVFKPATKCVRLYKIFCGRAFVLFFACSFVVGATRRGDDFDTFSYSGIYFPSINYYYVYKYISHMRWICVEVHQNSTIESKGNILKRTQHTHQTQRYKMFWKQLFWWNHMKVCVVSPRASLGTYVNDIKERRVLWKNLFHT